MFNDTSYDNFDEFLEELYTAEQKSSQLGVDQVYNLKTAVEVNVVTPQNKKQTKCGKNYQALKQMINRLDSVEWVEHASKVAPIKYFTPMTFWHQICAQYFSRDYSLDNIIQKISTPVEHVEENYSIQDELFLLDIHRWYQEQLPTQDIDTLIITYQLEHQKLYSQLIHDLTTIPIEQPRLKINCDSEDVLQDLIGFTELENQYLSYLENKQLTCEDQMSNNSKTINLAGTARQLLNEFKAICQICNEGPHSDDLIICCQKCNIQVHKKCYKLEQNHSEWICELCVNFGPKGRYLRCPLCSRKGGAMKQTGILMKDCRLESSNPTFQQFAMGQKNMRFRTSALSQKCENQKPLQGINLYYQEIPQASIEIYDFQIVQHLDENEDPPKSEYVWTHIVCTNWLDQNFNKVDRKKFNLTCGICKLKRVGACISCSKVKCGIAFHPECARRSQIFMEQNQLYCLKHQPLKLKRIFENHHEVWNEEIQLFYRQFEKFEQHLLTRPKVKDNDLRKLELRVEQQQIEAEIRMENEQLLAQLRKLLVQSNQFIITITHNVVTKIQYPSESQSKSIYELLETDTIFEEIQIENCTKEQVFLLYQRAIRMLKQKKKIRSSIIQQEDQPMRQRKSVYSKPQIIKNQKRKSSFKIRIPREVLTSLYCVCQRTFEQGDEMMQCETCKEWYHLSCLGFIQSIEKAQGIVFYCFRCEPKLSQEQKLVVGQQRHLFQDPTFRDLKIMIGMTPHELRQHERKNYKNLTK